MTLERDALEAPLPDLGAVAPAGVSLASVGAEVARCCFMTHLAGRGRVESGRNHRRGGGRREGAGWARCARSAVAELVEPVLAEAEAVRELVRDGDAHLAPQRGLVVAEVLDKRPAEERDQRRQHPR